MHPSYSYRISIPYPRRDHPLRILQNLGAMPYNFSRANLFDGDSILHYYTPSMSNVINTNFCIKIFTLIKLLNEMT